MVEDVLKNPLPYPQNLKEFIYYNTDFRYNYTISPYCSRYIDCVEMLEGKPVRRVFAFVAASRDLLLDDVLVREVARFYGNEMYLGLINANYYGGKFPIYNEKYKDSFEKWKKKWQFYIRYHLTDLNKFLKNNGLNHTGWEEYADRVDWRKQIDFEKYIEIWMKNPKVELLAKSGLGMWIAYIRNLDTKKKTIHEIFKIKEKCVPLLYRNDFGYRDLLVCRKTGSDNIVKIKRFIQVDDMIRNSRYEPEAIRDVLRLDGTKDYLYRLCKDPEFHTGDYIDYLRDLMKLNMELKGDVLYPKDFSQAHAEANEKIHIEEWNKLKEGFDKSYKKHKKYSWSNGVLIIIPVKTAKELYTESLMLGHCVKTYAPNVARGTTEIMFIRKKDDPDTPFYTLELKNRKVIQVRGFRNAEPKDEIKGFVRKWADRFKLQYYGDQGYMYY